MFNKISFKLILAIAVVATLVFTGFAILTFRTQSNLVMNQVKNFVNTQSETIKNSTKVAMLSNNREVTHEIIRTVGKQACVKQVRILNKEGKVMYAADSSQIGMILDKKAEACYSCHESDQPLEKLSISKECAFIAFILIQPELWALLILFIMNLLAGRQIVTPTPGVKKFWVCSI